MKRNKDGVLPYSGFVDCFAKSIKNEGVTGLWAGLSTYYMRIAPHAMITVLLQDFFHDIFTPKKHWFKRSSINKKLVILLHLIFYHIKINLMKNFDQFKVWRFTYYSSWKKFNPLQFDFCLFTSWFSLLLSRHCYLQCSSWLCFRLIRTFSVSSSSSIQQRTSFCWPVQVHSLHPYCGILKDFSWAFNCHDDPSTVFSHLLTILIWLTWVLSCYSHCHVLEFKMVFSW